MSDESLHAKIILPSVATEEELQNELQKVLSLNVGHVRGVSLKSDSIKAIEAKAGAGSTEKIQNKIKQLGFEVDYTKIDSYSWYPAGYDSALYLTAMHLFSWKREDIIDLARISTRGSILIKIIMRFVSMKTTLSGGPGVWRKYYDFGKLVPVEYSEKNSFIRFQIREYNVHPINELFHAGYFQGVVELVTGSKDVVVEVLSSVSHSDTCTEYKISW
ncbi:MAG: hypothetical protein WDZ75_02195 [Candidatus Paceibacterota bacterium]